MICPYSVYWQIATILALLFIISLSHAQAEQTNKVFGTPAGVSSGETCAGKPEGSACWLELENQPRCYVWNSHLEVNDTATWSAGCPAGLAEGTGTLTLVWGEKRQQKSTSTGQLRGGKQHGQWVEKYADASKFRAYVYKTDGRVHEGAYKDGLRHGRWVETYADGSVKEGAYVDGEAQGRWVLKKASGEVHEGPLVDGLKHGRWVVTFSDYIAEEGPYVNGKRHGQWVFRLNGDEAVGNFVEDKPHGQWVYRYVDGREEKGPYVNNNRHGKWVIRNADGTVEEVTYANGMEQ